MSVPTIVLSTLYLFVLVSIHTAQECSQTVDTIESSILTPVSPTSSLASVRLFNTSSSESATNEIADSQWQCELDDGRVGLCTYLTIRDDCACSSRIEIKVSGGRIRGGVDLFTVFSFDSPDHNTQYFSLLNDWDGLVRLPSDGTLGGVFIAPNCGAHFMSLGPGESIFDLFNTYDDTYLAASNGVLDNFELLSSDSDRVGDNSPLYITLQNDRASGQTRVNFDGGDLDSPVGCVLSDSIPSGSDLIVNFFSDGSDTLVGFDEFEVVYTCAEPLEDPCEQKPSPQLPKADKGLDFYLLLDLSASLSGDINALLLEMAEAFLFGGIEASWRDLYDGVDEVRFCLMGYNEDLYLLEHCTSSPTFLKSFYDLNTDGIAGNDVDILDYIQFGTESKMASAIYEAVTWILDGEIAGGVEGSTRLLMTFLQHGISPNEEDICDDFLITNIMEVNQINHILVQLESSTEGKIVGINEMAPLGCLINTKEDFVLETYYLFDIVTTPLGVIANNIRAIAASFEDLYSLNSDVTGYISFQSVRAKTYSSCISGAAFAQIRNILWLVNGNVTMDCKPTSAPTIMPSMQPSMLPSLVPTRAPSELPTMEPTEEPTEHPTEECNILRDDLQLSWDNVMYGNNAYGMNSDGLDPFRASIETKQVWTVGASGHAAFSLEVTARSKYIVEARYDSLFEYGSFGFTYVLDTNEFHSAGRLLQHANACENRLASSFDMVGNFEDFWRYTLNPSHRNELGNDAFLAYPEPNIWDLTAVGPFGTCDQVQWTSTLTLDEIVNMCKNNENKPSYSVSETSDAIIFNINFYLTAVSPNPLLLDSCGGADCGSYLTRTVSVKPVQLVFMKIGAVLGALGKNAAVPALETFSNRILATSFALEASKHGNDRYTGQFVITLLTAVPAYMALDGTSDASSLILLSPAAAALEAQNYGLSVDAARVFENRDAYVFDRCLVLTQGRCFQMFDVQIEFTLNDACPVTGLVFDGNYAFAARFDCIDENYNQTCQELRSDGSPLDITLEPAQLKYTQLCDADVYEVDWDASGRMMFYKDELLSEPLGNYTTRAGDVVYTHLQVKEPLATEYQVFGVDIDTCWLCSADSAVGGIGSCFDAEVDDKNLFEITSDPDLKYMQLEGMNSDKAWEDEYFSAAFSFEMPQMSDVEDKKFFVDCRVKLTVSNDTQTGRKLLSEDGTGAGNVLTRVIGRGIIGKAADTRPISATAGVQMIGWTGDENRLMHVLMLLMSVMLIMSIGACFAVFKHCQRKVVDGVECTDDVNIFMFGA